MRSTTPPIEAQLSANLLGPWRLARAAAASMVAGGAGGRIVIVASRAAVDVARGQAAYQVSKAAVLRLAQVMAAELQGHGITVNAVLPGTMDTARQPQVDAESEPLVMGQHGFRRRGHRVAALGRRRSR